MKRILTVCLTALVIMSVCAGCAGSADYQEPPRSAEGGAYESSYDFQNDYEADFGAYDDYDGFKYGAAAESGDSQGLGGALPSILDPANEDGIRLVYTVEMSLQTTEFPTGTRRLLEAVETAGGFVRSTYVEGRSLYTPDAPRLAQYTLSIPTTQLAEFLVVMEDDFNLVRLEQSSRDISGRVASTDRSLETVEGQIAELEALLETLEPQTEEDWEALYQLEADLYELRLERDALRDSAGGMDLDLRYSTVSVALYEVVDLNGVLTTAEEPYGTRLRDTAGLSWERFVRFWSNALLWLLTALPVLAVLVLLGALALLVWRVLRRSGLAKKIRMWLTPKAPARVPPQGPGVRPMQPPPYGNPGMGPMQPPPPPNPSAPQDQNGNGRQ